MRCMPAFCTTGASDAEEELDEDPDEVSLR
jgi:hypothetical protein